MQKLSIDHFGSFSVDKSKITNFYVLCANVTKQVKFK